MTTKRLQINKRDTITKNNSKMSPKRQKATNKTREMTTKRDNNQKYTQMS